MKQKIFHRSAQVEAVKPGTDLIPCVVSSDTPLRRGDYTEILVHTPAAIDLSRAPLPLIIQHDIGNLNVGLIEQLTIVGGKLRGMLRMGKSAKAKEILQDIQDGIVRSLSVGYVYKKFTDINDVVTATKWQPLEASLVAVPADPSAGLYRTFNHNLIKEHQMQHEIEDNEETTLSRSQRKREGRELLSHQAGAEAERDRSASLQILGKIHKIPENMVRQWIDSGVSIEAARAVSLEILLARGKNIQPIYQDHMGGSEHDCGFSNNDLRGFSISRALLASASGDWRKAGLERSMSEAIAQRASRQTQGFFIPVDVPMTRAPYAVGAAGTGGNIVATNLLAGSFIDILRNKCKVIELGATMLSGLVGNVDVPRRNASNTAYWQAEAGTITESEGTFDKVSLTPKNIAILSRFSRNMLLQSTPDIDMLIRSDMIQKIAQGIDLAALSGSGSSNQPLGIFGTSGIGSVVGGTNGAAILLDNCLDLIAAVLNANAEGSNMGFIMNSKTQAALSKLKTTTGEYVWKRGNQFSSIAEGGVDKIGGYPVAVSNQARSNLTKGTSSGVCSEIFFGDWSSLVIGEWGVLEVLPNPYSATGFATGQIDIRAIQSVDIGVRHPESFAVMNDALTS